MSNSRIQGGAGRAGRSPSGKATAQRRNAQLGATNREIEGLARTARGTLELDLGGGLTRDRRGRYELRRAALVSPVAEGDVPDALEAGAALSDAVSKVNEILETLEAIRENQQALLEALQAAGHMET